MTASFRRLHYLKRSDSEFTQHWHSLLGVAWAMSEVHHRPFAESIDCLLASDGIIARGAEEDDEEEEEEDKKDKDDDSEDEGEGYSE